MSRKNITEGSFYRIVERIDAAFREAGVPVPCSTDEHVRNYITETQDFTIGDLPYLVQLKDREEACPSLDEATKVALRFAFDEVGKNSYGDERDAILGISGVHNTALARLKEYNGCCIAESEVRIMYNNEDLADYRTK